MIGAHAVRQGWPAHLRGVVRDRDRVIALFALGGILLHLAERWQTGISSTAREAPLLIVLLAGGGPLVFDLARKAVAGRFGSDLLAAISIVSC